MPQNGIRMVGITALAGGLAKCKEMQCIDLQDNTFMDDGATTGVQAWAEALPSWPKLHTLNLSDCVLSEGGKVSSIIKTLASGSNPNLRILELQNNNLDAKTFALLADAISTHLRNVMVLALQWNDVDEDEEALETLGDALKARGGKLFSRDEDEEAAEEEEEDILLKYDDDDETANNLADLLGAARI